MTEMIAQCISGLQDVVAQALREDLSDCIVHSIEDGQVVFATSKPELVATLAYLNNSFAILDEGVVSNPQNLPAYIAYLTDGGWQACNNRSDQCHSFRMMVSDENQLQAMDARLMSNLAQTIARTTGLVLSPRGADTEFWIMRRRSGEAYFGQRLSKRGKTERDLRKGELRPELTDLLCRISECQPTDIIMDPFAGSGAIGFARVQRSYKKIFLSDSDAKTIAEIKKKTLAGNIVVDIADARHLKHIPDQSIDKIITDPPWGFYDALPDLPGFYQNVMTELCRVTKSGGSIILLLGRRDMIDPLTQNFADKITQENCWDILVSGKKAAIIKWRRL